MAQPSIAPPLQNNLKKNLGTVPKPRQSQPPRHHFTTKNYRFANGDIISLPVRPAQNLAKRDEDHFRDIIKQIAIDLDKNNNRFFITYRHDANKQGDWWQSGGNSVLFYHHHYAKKCQLSPINLRPDNDYGCTWSSNTYVVMIKNIAHMVAQLQDKAKAKLVLDSPELIVLEYPTKFSDNDIKSYRRSDSSRREYVNKLLLPKIVNPHTYRSIVELYRIIGNRVNNLNINQRRSFGDQLLQLAQEITLNFVSMSNGRIPVSQYYNNALAKINYLCDLLVTVQNFKIFTVDELYRIATLAEQVKRNINNELQQLQSKSTK